MLLVLCEHWQGENDAELIQMLQDGFDVALALQSDQITYSFVIRERRLQILELIRKFGHRDLASELASQLPDADEYWFEDSVAARQYLDWFNEHFELKAPLTIKEVFQADAESDWSLVSGPGAFAPRYFKVACFQAAGFGRVVDPENFGNDGGLFAEISKLSGEQIRVEAHDLVEGHSVRLLIKDSVYEFPMSEDWSWYENCPACDVLNAILERRRIAKRLFVFKYAYGNSYVKLVVFAKPEAVKEFVEKHEEFEVVEGCEKYWSGGASEL